MDGVYFDPNNHNSTKQPEFFDMLYKGPRPGDPGYWEWRRNHLPFPTPDNPGLEPTPALVYQAACEYFDVIEQNKYWKEDFIKAGNDAGKIVRLAQDRTFTMIGLSIFLKDCDIFTFDLNSALQNKNGKYDEYKGVMEFIRNVIREQKFSGAAAGVFNSNFIARDLGMTEKVQAAVVAEQPLFGDSTDTAPTVVETDTHDGGEGMDSGF